MCASAPADDEQHADCRSPGVPPPLAPARQEGADRLDSAVAVAREQLPAARQQPGFKGFYVLADSETGKLMTISLWETREHLQAVEAHAAQTRSQAASDLGTAPPPVDTYEVVMTA